MKKIDWGSVKPVDEFDNPVPGGYIAKIITVTDVEEKEYLKVEWEFAEGTYKGYNGDTFSRAGFWPCAMFCSYKDSARGFFKAFLNAIEASNPGYSFDCDHPELLIGKVLGVVLGEEEYTKSNGKPGKRLYVAQKRSVKQIQDGDFKVPEKKQKDNDYKAADVPSYSQDSYQDPYSDFSDGEKLPWDE